MKNKVFILAWTSGHTPPKTVYYHETDKGWGVTYDRNEAKQFKSAKAATDSWLYKHTWPEEYVHCIKEGRVRAEIMNEPMFNF